VEDATVAVVGVFAQAHVAHDVDRRKFSPDELNALDDRGVGSVRHISPSILVGIVVNDSKQYDGRKALVYKRRQKLRQLVDPQAELARHGRNRNFVIGLVGDEQGVHKGFL
jgi:hypothetical protein